MPTILKLLGFRFFFYSNEGNEDPHVHVEKGDAHGKYWLDPLKEDYMRNFKAGEERKAKRIIEENQADFKEKWNEYFKK